VDDVIRSHASECTCPLPSDGADEDERSEMSSTSSVNGNSDDENNPDDTGDISTVQRPCPDCAQKFAALGDKQFADQYSAQLVRHGNHVEFHPIMQPKLKCSAFQTGYVSFDGCGVEQLPSRVALPAVVGCRNRRMWINRWKRSSRRRISW